MIVFFDIDDTLLDHSRAMREAAIRLHASAGLSCEVETFVSEWLASHRRNYSRYLVGDLSYEELRRLRIRETVSMHLQDQAADELFAAYMNAYCSEWKLFSDVVPCLDALRTIVLEVISNGPSDEQREKLRSLGIEDRFGTILISKECRFFKPAAEIFQLACQMAGVAPGDAVYIGDQLEIDIHGAQNAGLKAFWLNRRGKPNDAVGVELIRSLAELPERLFAS